MYEFSRRVDSFNNLNYADLAINTMGAWLSSYDSQRLSKYRTFWNFYEGFHWEDIGDTGKPQITENYCRPFVNKFVAFELGKQFSIKMKPEVEEDVLPFLNEVWGYNHKKSFCKTMGITKGVTGECWIQVVFIPKYMDDDKNTLNPDFDDPFDEFEGGKIRLLPVPPNICFPRYDDGFDKDKMLDFTIMYPIKRYPQDVNSTEMILYRQVWDKTTCKIYKGNDLLFTIPNKYGFIPFVQAKNFELPGRTSGVSDLEDLIPINAEMNLKKSDVSEIIDYYSAPITCVYGARIGQLEKGANKVWGGLPKDGKVENIELRGDLGASNNYIDGIKQAMHEIGGVPEGALGKETAISNTSGVALQVQMMPLIERVRDKQALTGEALSLVNKMILKIAVMEGLITIPEGIKNKDFYHNEINFEDSLPKDILVTLQAIQLEMKLGLCDREEAMKRLGKTDIQKRIAEIVADMEKVPFIYGLVKDPMTGELTNQPTKVPSSGTVMERPSGTNKAGNPSTVNAGYNNSQQKQQQTNS